MESACGREFPVLAQKLFGNVRLHFSDAPIERRYLRSAMLGQCRVSELMAGAHTVYGDHVVRASHDPDMLKLLIQSEGISLIEQGGRAVSVGRIHAYADTGADAKRVAAEMEVRLQGCLDALCQDLGIGAAGQVFGRDNEFISAQTRRGIAVAQDTA